MAYPDSVMVPRNFIHYEPGDLITPACSQSMLDRGRVYRVVKFAVPAWSEDSGTVFVEGVRWGEHAEYVRLPNDEELDAYYEEADEILRVQTGLLANR